MKTLKIFLVILLILIVAKAYALKPQPVPQHIQQEAANAVTIHQGYCPDEDKQTLCMIAFDEAKETFWVLLFNEGGVLYKVLAITKEKEVTKWVHPQMSV